MRSFPAFRTGLSAPVCAIVAGVATLMIACSPASAYSERSVGSPEQIAWVRRAAGNFLAAELAGNGAGACAVLAAPLRATRHNRTCTQRWDVELAAVLRRHGSRARLDAERRAVSSARVVVRGAVATIELPRPLIGGPNRFVWSENCWMLEG